ncbi:recombinase family protein [Pseudomonas jessenii]|uniref:recombinase family protein n=1 Tax=Pseudomonas jessenii TaxID=77298 RepID=UPI0038911FA9
MVDVAYIRVSSVDQNVDRQLDGLAFTKTFTDKVSGATTERPALQDMIGYVREGDTVHVHSIDRLARSLQDLLKLVEQINAKGVAVKFHKENLLFTGDKHDATQHLMLSMIGAVAEFERSMIKERQREGIAKAKAKGVYKGRTKAVTNDDIRAAITVDKMSYRDAAKALGVSVSSVQRAMKGNTEV